MTHVRRRLLAGATLLAVPLLLTACGQAKELVAPAGDTTSATSTSSAPQPNAPTSATDGSPGPGPAVDVAAVTPRSVAYGMFDVSVLGARIAAVDPSTFDDPTRTQQPSDTTFAFVKVKVHNRLAFSTDAVSFDEVTLDLGDGNPVTMATGVGHAVDNVDPGTTVSGWYAYPVPAGTTTLDGASLHLGKQGYQQEVLPLTGDVPAPQWPKTITVASPGTVVSTSPSKPVFTVTVDRATLSNAVAFDLDGRSYTPERALTGHRLLTVDFTARRVGGKFGETFSYDTLRLAVDGEVRSGDPVVSESFNLAPGEVHHSVFVFDVPSSGRVELRWGRAAVATPVPVP